MNGVERSPYVHSVAQAVEQFLRECAEVAVFVLRLALGKFGNHEIAVSLEFFVPRTGERQRASRKVMPAGKVPAQFAIGLFPITQRLRRGRQTGSQAKRMKQAVGRERLQIFPVSRCRRAECSRLESHILQREWARLRHHNLVVHGPGCSRGTGAKVLVLQCQRGHTKYRACADGSGSRNELTAANGFHHDLL